MEKPRIHSRAGTNYVQLFIEISAMGVRRGDWDYFEVPRLSRSVFGHKMLFIFLPLDHQDVGWRVFCWHVENGHRDVHTTKRLQISVGSLQLPVPNLRMFASHPSWPGHRAAAFHCLAPPTPSYCHIAQLHLSALGVGVCLTLQGSGKGELWLFGI